MVDEGILSQAEAENSKSADVLWNCVGGENRVQPHAHRAELSVGDALLLCSDGLTKHVSDQQIEEMLAGIETSEAACKNLVDAANQGGGTDNVTAVLARFQDLADQQALAAQASQAKSPVTRHASQSGPRKATTAKDPFESLT